ncbi:MAG: S8 family peptidase [Gaiellaceae bacterium]
MVGRAVAGVVAALFLAPAAPAATVAPAASPQHVAPMHWFDWHGAARVQGRFGSTAVIGLTSNAALRTLRERYAFERVHALPQLRAVEVRVTRAQLRTLLRSAPTDPLIRYVSPLGASRRPLAMPNDPLVSMIDPATMLPFEWQFEAAHVDRALDFTAGSASVLVGTIDTGVADIPDLAGKIDSRWNISTDGPLTPIQVTGGNDVQGHGTAVASLIAANVGDGFGMAGFGGAAHVVAIKAGDRGFSDTAVAIALAHLDSLGVRIVNMSFGGNEPDAPIVVDAIHKAAADGMLLIASTGNDAAYVAYPAAELQPLGGVRSYGLSVGASDVNGAPAIFTNSGRHLSLLAPGYRSGVCTGVLVATSPPVNQFDRSCYPVWDGAGGARYAYVAGTSFAAPEVAGVAALIWAARPELKNYQVADIIKQSAQRPASSGWTAARGCGVLDAGAALELAMSRTPAQWAAGRDPGSSLCSVAGAHAAAWPAVDPAPSVSALPALGEWGHALTLKFKVDEDTHEIKAAMTVRKNGKTVAKLASGALFRVRPGASYGLLWRAPRRTKKAAYTFCVTLTSRSAKKSGQSCARITLK